jgi:hypothetical protein
LLVCSCWRAVRGGLATGCCAPQYRCCGSELCRSAREGGGGVSGSSVAECVSSGRAWFGVLPLS